jgi:hypothetical protein
MIRAIMICGTVCLIAACATQSIDAQELTPRAAAQMLIGAYDNQDQFTAAPDSLKRPPAPGYPYDWIDVQHGVFQSVSAPEIGDNTLYVEWRRGDGSISRQRLWSFRQDENGHVRMEYFSFRTPDSFVAKRGDDPVFAALRADDMISYGPACALHVTSRSPDQGWLGVIDEASCEITGTTSGRRMGLRVRLAVGPDGLSYEEAGILPDGAYAFKVPGGVPYKMKRRTPPL